MKKRIITLLAILALLVTCAVFAVQAEGEAYDWTSAFDGTQQCPHCGKVVPADQWVEYKNQAFVTNTHYKISEDLDLNGLKTSGSNSVVIWIQDNVTVRAKDATRAFQINNANGCMWLLGGKDSKIIGTGATDSSTKTFGGLIRILVGGKMYIGGGLTIELSNPVASGHMGGLVDIYSGTLYMKGGTLKGITNNGTGTVYGGVVISAATGKFEMTGGTIDGGSAKEAPVYVAAAGTVDLKGGTINARENASNDGGAVYAAAGTVNIDGATINGSKSLTKVGGAVYATGANTTVNMISGTIYGDAEFAGTQGSAVAVYGSATFNMTGGTIINNCTAKKSGIRVQNSNFYLQGGEVKAVDGGDNRGAFDILSTSADKPSYLVLAGDGKISNADGGVTANNTYVEFYNSNTCYLYVDNNWTGHANVRFQSSKNATYGKLYGRNATNSIDQGQCGAWDAEKKSFTKGGGHKGNLIAGAIDADPGLYGSGGLLMVMRCLLIGEKDGEEQTYWYITPNEAFSDISTKGLDNAFVRLACDYHVLVPKDIAGVLDLNGCNIIEATSGDDAGKAVILREGASLAVFDKDATLEAPSSAVIEADADLVEPYCEAPNGKTYVANNGKVYEIEYKITNVSLRPSQYDAGLYYTASVKAHADAGLQNWGVAVTIKEDAGNDLDADYLYSQIKETNADNSYNGALVKGIVKTGEDAANQANYVMPIYAKAYVTLADGTVLISEAANMSLDQVIKAVEERDPEGLTAAQKTAIADMQASGWYKGLYTTGEEA